MKKQTQKTLLSGIQPSGKLHLGSYIGAIKNWVKLQYDHNCFFSIVDLHTITVKQDPKSLRQRCFDFLALYLASGIDPEKNIIFCQSHVPAHTQLAWILNCYAHMGELNRMTQFKDKSKNNKNTNVGLFDYPVLMASDILLYETDIVPTGKDQKQHIELARDLALRFNNIYGEIFTIPKPYILSVKEGSKIMSLQDPYKKMSKSDVNENNVIGILDTPEEILNKFKRAVTDSENLVHFDESKPGISNLLTIYSAVTDKPIEKIESDYKDGKYGVFKTDVAEAVIEYLKPIREKYNRLRKDEASLKILLDEGAEKAKCLADPMIEKVYDAIGFIV